MRESRSFRKKARLLFNLSTSSTSCRERQGRMFMREGRGRASGKEEGLNFKYILYDTWSLYVGLFKICLSQYFLVIKSPILCKIYFTDVFSL